MPGTELAGQATRFAKSAGLEKSEADVGGALTGMSGHCRATWGDSCNLPDVLETWQTSGRYAFCRSEICKLQQENEDRDYQEKCAQQTDG